MLDAHTEESHPILMVEDNPGDVRLLSEALKEVNLEQTLNVVNDGVEAIRYLQHEGKYSDSQRPAIVVLDLDLPRKNGKEVLAEIKADPELRRIPVIIFSTSPAERDIQGVYDLHANCYIVKPDSFDRFMEIVQAIKEFWLRAVSLPS